MVSKENILEVLNFTLSEYMFKCSRNKIPTSESPYIMRLSSAVRKTFNDFIDKNCGENHNSNEQLWIVNNRNDQWDGDIRFIIDGDEDSVKLDYAHSNDLYQANLNKGLTFHEIHNHPKSEGFRDKMPECLSSEDILSCVTNDWSQSITAVNGTNKSMMTLMKGKDFHNDFEVEAEVLAIAYRLENAYFDYMNSWESETRKVWDNDEANGNPIAKEIMNNPPTNMKGGITNVIHSKYEEIAQNNIGSFEESISDLRKALNKHDLDISIEYPVET